MVEISGALHYGVPHNHIVVLGRKTPDIIIIDEGRIHRVQDETLYLAELVAEKRKVKLQQYTLHTDSGEQSVGGR